MALVIGLIYGRNEDWIAGSYYIQNLVHALATLPGQLPHLKIYSEKQSEYEELKKSTTYPNISWVPLIDRNTIADKIFNKITYTLFKKHFVTRGIDVEVDVLFPASDTYFFDNIKSKLIWIPDFQEHHFPNLFSIVEREKRKSFLTWVIEKNHPVVFSSNHSKNDFLTFYPEAKNRTWVMPFAVTLPDLRGIHLKELRNKFELTGDYFICSNQFWAHKNHQLVLQALVGLRNSNINAKVVFTGRPHDNRNPSYYSSLLEFVRENKLEDCVMFLGFIDRTEQLVLMKNSLAIIQPSLFEGWSTVVEDAKALSVPIIVSDIPVHREQLGERECFFPKDDVSQLKEKMKKILTEKIKGEFVKYNENVKNFGNDFLKIISQIV